MPVHAFLDETKERGLLVAVAVVHPRSLGPARKALRELLLPGQGRLHFTKERVQRRRVIASAICALGADVDIYDARGVADQRRARAAVLELVIRDLVRRGAHRVVLEQDDSLVTSDNRTIRAALGSHVHNPSLIYEHLPPRSEPLLWVPDAVAWCWTHGATWRTAVQPVVRTVREISRSVPYSAKPGSPTVRRAAGLTSRS